MKAVRTQALALPLTVAISPSFLLCIVGSPKVLSPSLHLGPQHQKLPGQLWAADICTSALQARRTAERWGCAQRVEIPAERILHLLWAQKIQTHVLPECFTHHVCSIPLWCTKMKVVPPTLHFLVHQNQLDMHGAIKAEDLT